MFDTHLHLVDRSRLSYPWLSAVPALDRDWTCEEYERTAQRIGITGALHMEVDVAAEDIDRESAFVAELMDRPGSLIRGAISAARPEDAGFAAWLDRVDRRVVKGVRRVLHTVPDDISQSARFRENLRRLGAAGLPFDICMLARQLPLAIELVDAAPDTVFVIDHCGVPDIVGGDFAAWSSHISDLARRPNTNGKISGIVAYGGPDWTLEDLRPYVSHMIAAFGPDRLVWGSDSPVCTLHASLPEWVAATRSLLDDCSAQDREAILDRNALRIYGLGG
jgi:predicted TIM-barrel fold metal-dependent hydrolase